MKCNYKLVFVNNDLNIWMYETSITKREIK